MNIGNIEIMAPAGSYESLAAAIRAGADSVYFGVGKLNMRARAAESFSVGDLGRIADICREKKVKSYVAVNTIIYDEDIDFMKKICNAAKSAGIRAVIASDVSVMEHCKSIGIPVHISTQANVSNLEAVRFYSRYADVIVLARELNLKQIKNIVDRIGAEGIKGPGGELVRVELFAHGALCVSIAGKCYMSLAAYNKSANRGECLQKCRRAYRVIDEETGDEMVVENKYVMSPKDLCTIRFLNKIIDSGVSVLKIEGRARKPEYVYTVTRAYKEAVNSYFEGSFSKEKVERWERELASVYNRGFWHGGYYLGKKLGEWSGIYGSKSTQEKEYIGKAENYFAKKGVGLFKIESGELKVGDEIAVMGNTTGVVKSRVCKIIVNDGDSDTAVKGDLVTVALPEKIRRGDRIYALRERKG